MKNYQIQTPCVFDIEAETEQEAKDKLIANLLQQDTNEFYGSEMVYVPYDPMNPEFMKVIDVEEEN